MKKYILLEMPDGSIQTRGGMGPSTLASFLIFNRDGVRRRLKHSDAVALLADASEDEVEAAIDTGLAYIRDSLVPKQNADASTVTLTDTDSTPLPQRFRGAWRVREGKVETDMAKARDIHMDDIRKAREPEFAKADNDLKVAEDKGDTAEIARIRAKRQALRDIPQTFDLSGAKTPDELAALWPAELPR